MKSPRVNFRLPEKQLQAVDLLVKARIFNDRSQFFKRATEHLLQIFDETVESLRKEHGNSE